MGTINPAMKSIVAALCVSCLIVANAQTVGEDRLPESRDIDESERGLLSATNTYPHCGGPVVCGGRTRYSYVPVCLEPGESCELNGVIRKRRCCSGRCDVGTNLCINIGSPDGSPCVNNLDCENVSCETKLQASAMEALETAARD